MQYQLKLDDTQGDDPVSGMDVSASIHPPAFSFDGWNTANTNGNDYTPIPKGPGVYAMFSRNFDQDSREKILHYIGSSKNIYNRIEKGEHTIKKKVWNEYRDVCIYFKECEDYLIEEKRLIQLHKPHLNKRLK